MESLLSKPYDYDAAPVAPFGSLGGVPLIDLADAGAPEAIGAACRDWGFFQLLGHGVTGKEIDRAIATARSYFALPGDEKRRQSRSRDNPWGYYDRELTKEQRDRKEIFDIGPDAAGLAPGDGEPFDAVTPWPGEPTDFQTVMTDWFQTATRLSERLVTIIAEAIDQRGALETAFARHTSYLRLNHYPTTDPLAGEAENEAKLGIHHHTDAGALTVLLQDGVSGLQVFREGHWHDVTPHPGALTINIGDMIQVWSNDRFRAPLHRVLAMERSERLSLAFFYNPSYAANVAPLAGQPRYKPINWGEFRRKRADGDFADYGTEVQIADYRLDLVD